MIKLRYKIGAILAVLLGIFLWGRYGKSPFGPPGVNTILPANELEQLQIDPSKHRISILNSSGLKVLTLPDRNSTVDIYKNGSVKITSPQFGFEHHIFIGGMLSDVPRVGIGVDLGYWKRLDFGLGAADQIGPHVPVVFGKISYNFWSNMQGGVTYDNMKHAGLAVTVRI
jgi:hypothetical protein